MGVNLCFFSGVTMMEVTTWQGVKPGRLPLGGSRLESRCSVRKVTPEADQDMNRGA